MIGNMSRFGFMLIRYEIAVLLIVLLLSTGSYSSGLSEGQKEFADQLDKDQRIRTQLQKERNSHGLQFYQTKIGKLHQDLYVHRNDHRKGLQNPPHPDL